jgi:hypothetical protein
MSYWVLFGSLLAINYTIAVPFNLLVVYIMLFHFRLKGVDCLLSFILAVIDIAYAIFGILNFILYESASGKLHENRLYCIITKLYVYCFSTIGLHAIVALAIVRYLAICKKTVLSEFLVLTILLVISPIPIIGFIICIYNSKLILNSETLICSFVTPFGSVYNKLLIFLNLYPLVYLVAIAACYIPIMRYYSKMKLILSECGEACNTSINMETGKNTQTYQYSHSQSGSSQNSGNTSSLTNTPESQKFLPILKIASIILMYFFEIVPYFSIQAYLSITNNTEKIKELSVHIALLILDLIPLTNTFLLLFIHEETWKEVRLWGAIWGNWIRKKL